MGKADYNCRVLPECNRGAGESGAKLSGGDWELPTRLRPISQLGRRVRPTGAVREGGGSVPRSLRLAPDNVASYGNLTNSLLALQRFDEVRQIIQQAQARKLDIDIFHNALYALAFLASDSPSMAEQQQWFAAQPDYEN